MNNFRYALVLAQKLYDVKIIDEEDAIEVGLIAYNFIGNKKTILKKARLKAVDGIVTLPCDVDIIEAVTYCNLEDWNSTSNTEQYGEYESLYTENYIESQKAFLDPFYISGKYVNYKRVDDKLYINKGLSSIQILYQSELRDEDDLPQLTDKESIAIAEYIAYTYKYKEAIKTNNQLLLQVAQDLRNKWLFHCDAARVPQYVAQDEMDKILNAQTSWDRKIYNKSYKPV